MRFLPGSSGPRERVCFAITKPFTLRSKFEFSFVAPIHFLQKQWGELDKNQDNSSCVIMSVILMTTLFYKALILRGEIWCWSLLGLKGLSIFALVPNVNYIVIRISFFWVVIPQSSRIMLVKSNFILFSVTHQTMILCLKLCSAEAVILLNSLSHQLNNHPSYSLWYDFAKKILALCRHYAWSSSYSILFKILQS